MPSRKACINISAAILAGGMNKRMEGKDKAFIQIDGKPIIHKTMSLLKNIFEEIVIVTNSEDKYSTYKTQCNVVTDKIKGIGPLGGIYTALSNTAKQAVFFAACDMPFLHNAFIFEEILHFSRVKCDAFLPRIGGLAEPLCAIYKKKLENKIYDFIKTNDDYSIKYFLQTVNTYYWDIEDNPFNRNIFKNINTQEDLNSINGNGSVNRGKFPLTLPSPRRGEGKGEGVKNTGDRPITINGKL